MINQYQHSSLLQSDSVVFNWRDGYAIVDAENLMHQGTILRVGGQEHNTEVTV